MLEVWEGIKGSLGGMVCMGELVEVLIKREKGLVNNMVHGVSEEGEKGL